MCTDTPAGDLVLQSVAHPERLCASHGHLARYGGEEFAVVLCQSAFGHMVAERIRRAVANTPIRISPMSS